MLPSFSLIEHKQAILFLSFSVLQQIKFVLWLAKLCVYLYYHSATCWKLHTCYVQCIYVYLYMYRSGFEKVSDLFKTL